MREFLGEELSWPDGIPVPHPNPHLLGCIVDAASLSETVPHLNNIAILHLIDRAAETHLDALGFSRQAMASVDRMWFVARHEIDYRAEAFSGDRLVVATWVVRYGRTTSVRASRIARISDGVLIAEATSRWAHIDLATRRPTRIPDELPRVCPPEIRA